jgi:hypothetical protein
MCVLTIKKDEMFNPPCAKSWIIALGNHEDCIWTKSEKYAPVLQPDLMRLITSMAIEKYRTLKKGNCKTRSAKASCPMTRSQSLNPQLATLMLKRMNIGY